jgi:copper chaperone CopZ
MKAEFHIQGPRDETTATKLKEALESTAGVFKADVIPDAKTVNVMFDENVVQEKTLIKKIQDLGYQATIGDEQTREAGA